jgi:hypothetical protein
VSQASQREELLSELDDDGNSLFSGGVWNNVTDLSLTSITVIASLVATVLATTDSKDVARWAVATIAAIPAAATALQRIVGIRERSDWYFLYAARVRALATQLRYAANPDIEEYGKKFADLEEVMEAQWTKIGRSGSGRRARAGS